MTRFVMLVTLVLLLMSQTSAAQEVFAGRVVSVTDGDTIVISPNGGAFVKCRLYGIDAPEMAKKGKKGDAGQLHARESARMLKGMVLTKEVSITTVGKDRYNRSICFVVAGGLDVNLEMVVRGGAWAYRKYLDEPHLENYAAAEEEARKARRGLWKEERPVPPWDYRKRIRQESGKELRRK